VKEGRTLVVGFVDLVGFTAVSQQLTEHELAAMVDRFEQVAYEHISQARRCGVKMIGDEVMFSVADAGAAAEIALGFRRGHTATAACCGNASRPGRRTDVVVGR